MTTSRIQDRAIGRWHHILPAIGIPKDHLTGKHGPCPICGGKDRFRFDNKGGNGTFFCANPKCGPGSGVELVMRHCKVPFLEAKRMIEQHLPDAVVVVPKSRDRSNVDKLERVWAQSMTLDGHDIASRYLASRGIELADLSPALRIAHRAMYRHEDDRVTTHPALVSRITGFGGAGMTLHYTFLDPDGGKAKLPDERKLAPAKFPEHGAVRLFRPADTMGIAEGIETALSAARLYGMPVWAAVNAPMLAKWKPPTEARCIYVFGDNDANFTGQHAAYALAQCLTMSGYEVEVRIPSGVGRDWNDLLLAHVSKEVGNG
jgi:putative DNA primase/helicase